MGYLSAELVNLALESYEKSLMLRSKIFEGSEKLRFLQIEVTDFATELIARYQPVATDLRLIQSYMDASYGFSRFGRYAYDIAETLDTIGPLPKCDKSQITEMAKIVRVMIELSVKSLEKLDENPLQKLYMMDDSVDSMFRNYLKQAITQTKKRNFEPKCYVLTLLILRYLERISDHACYIGDSVHYVVTGDPSPRR